MTGDRVKKITVDRDPRAFKSLFLTFGPKVRSMLMRQGADRETADEIVQDTMLAVWHKSHLFEDHKGSLSTWIYAIARNLRIDRIRKQILWRHMCADLEAMRHAEPGYDESHARQQERIGVDQALAVLPQEQFQIIHLSFMEGLTQSEIAKRLDLPLGTVKSRMRLAFDKLRSSVEGTS
jgi:RNA polymerase sigma-70 factor (ECF subfamily)